MSDSLLAAVDVADPWAKTNGSFEKSKGPLAF